MEKMGPILRKEKHCANHLWKAGHFLLLQAFGEVKKCEALLQFTTSLATPHELRKGGKAEDIHSTFCILSTLTEDQMISCFCPKSSGLHRLV